MKRIKRFLLTTSFMLAMGGWAAIPSLPALAAPTPVNSIHASLNSHHYHNDTDGDTVDDDTTTNNSGGSGGSGTGG